MLRLHHVILVMALLVALTSESQERSRHHAPTTQIQKTEQAAAQDQRGTEKQPFTVNVVPTAEQKTEAEKQKASAERKLADDEKLISYTGDLVLVGLVQFAVFLLQLIAFTVQACYMRQSAAEMRNTTAAAQAASQDQIAHSHQVQRSYLWPGFGKHEPSEGGMRWFVTVTNTGRMAGVLKIIHYAVITDDDYEAGEYKFKTFTDREDIIPPGTGNPGQPTGLDFPIKCPMICCGWIEYEDVFGLDRKQGWKHRLRLTEDSAGNWSIPFPDCYSAAYKPWEGAEIEIGDETKQ